MVLAWKPAFGAKIVPLNQMRSQLVLFRGKVIKTRTNLAWTKPEA